MYKLLIISAFLLGFAFYSCSDNSVETVSGGTTLLYQKTGLVDSIVGTCSTFLTRTYEADTLNLLDYKNMRFEIDASTDGDLSEIQFFYLSSGTIVELASLTGVDEINNTKTINIPSPKIREKIFVRMKLFASVCTGQYYHLKLRNLRISGVD